MNLRDLQYLVLLAEQKSFRKAAMMANVTQPTLSNQIRKLEEELGILLFERDNRNVAVTSGGEAILDEARQVLNHANAMRDIAAGYHDPLSGSFRLGVIASLSPFFSPALLGQLAHDAPRMPVHLFEGVTQDLETKLLDRQLDAIITATEPVDPSLQTTPLFREPFMIALPTRHPAAKKDRVYIEDLAEDEILLLEEGHCLRDQILPFCRTNTVQEQNLGASSLVTLINMVKQGLGVTFLPITAVTDDLKGCRVRVMGGRPAYRDVRLVTRKNFPRTQAAALVAYASQGLFKKL